MCAPRISKELRPTGPWSCPGRCSVGKRIECFSLSLSKEGKLAAGGAAEGGGGELRSFASDAGLATGDCEERVELVGKSSFTPHAQPELGII